MIFNEALTQCLTPLDYLPPQSINNVTVNTSGIDMSKAARAVWAVQAGSLGAAGVLQVLAQSSPYSAFNSAIHNLANSTITNLTVNNTVTQYEVRGDQVQYQNPGDRYVRLQLIGSGNALTAGVLGYGGCAPQGPASQNNNTTIVTTVLCST